MGALKFLYDEKPKRVPFKIPLQSEVSKYIHEKKGWPKGFCDEYADKFWNYYQAQGWKLSNGNAMKDWQACFNVNWQNIRFEIDQKLLEKYKREEQKEKGKDMHPYDMMIELSKNGTFKPDQETLIRVYDDLKKNGFMKLPKETIDLIQEQGGNSNDAKKCLAVRYFFKKMMDSGMTFKELYGAD